MRDSGLFYDRLCHTRGCNYFNVSGSWHTAIAVEVLLCDMLSTSQAKPCSPNNLATEYPARMTSNRRQQKSSVPIYSLHLGHLRSRYSEDSADWWLAKLGQDRVLGILGRTCVPACAWSTWHALYGAHVQCCTGFQQELKPGAGAVERWDQCDPKDQTNDVKDFCYGWFDRSSDKCLRS